ncbi:MAG: rhodanese-like domain-containing protein [Desulfuromonas sp.]|nr:MAG: rhodanese-like domain-containing protein [Desulfuromonas sp.]
MSNPLLSPALRRTLLEAVVLCVFAFAVGVSINFRVVFDAFSGRTVSATRIAQTAPVVEAQPDAAQPELFPFPAMLEELDALVADGALLVDARNADAYRAGHLPGAVSLPLGELDAKLAGFKEQVPLDRIIIAYCSGYGCPDSFDLGVRLLQEGYAEVLVYEGGIPEWHDAGRPLEGAGQ